MESALRGMGQSNVDVGVLQETKLTDGIYTRRWYGYKVVATLAPRRHRGGVALFYWESPAFAVEAICQFGANVIACQLATGERRWYIIGCYMAPGDRETIRGLEAEMAERPKGTELIVAGNLNVDLRKAGGRGRDGDIVAAVAKAGVEKGSEDMGSGDTGEGSEVPDGIHLGIRPPDLPERGRTGPESQL